MSRLYACGEFSITGCPARTASLRIHSEGLVSPSALPGIFSAQRVSAVSTASARGSGKSTPVDRGAAQVPPTMSPHHVGARRDRPLGSGLRTCLDDLASIESRLPQVLPRSSTREGAR